MIILFSGMKDKDINENLNIIYEFSNEIIFTQIPVSRSITKEFINETFGNRFLFIENIKDAIKIGEEKAGKENKIFVIIGSLYLAGEVLKSYSP
jgi:folylpolyglutamate synthase/dihydropteroate synthase